MQLVPVDYDPFAAPSATPAAPAAPAGPKLVPVDYDPFAVEQPSVGRDVLAAGKSGLVTGVMGLPGLPGDVVQAVAPIGLAIGNKLREMSGKAPLTAEEKTALQSQHILPTTADIMSVAGYQPYEPQTTAGRFVKTAAEFVPAAVAGGAGALAKAGVKAIVPAAVKQAVKYGVVPGVASEAAGEAVETVDPAMAPYARMAGAVLGAGLPAAVRKAVTPLRIPEARREAAAILQKEGVTDLTAGQISGNHKLRYTESELGGTAGEAMMERQAEQFTRAALRRAGIDAPRATPEVINSAFDRIGGEFDRLAAGNVMRFDPKLNRDLADILDDYQAVTAPSQQAPIVGKVAGDLAQAVMAASRVKGVAVLEGEAYQNLRSQLERAARSARNDPQLAQTLRDMKDALDGAMERSIKINNPGDLGAWRRVRRQYRNMLVLEKAASAAGENAAAGLISPAQLRAATVAQGRRAYARGKGDFADLARAGETVMKPLPNSGTAGRTAARNLIMAVPAAIGAALGSTHAGVEGGLAGATAGALAPSMVGRALLSKWARWYLTNQAWKAPPKAGLRAGLPVAVNATNPLRMEEAP